MWIGAGAAVASEPRSAPQARHVDMIYVDRELAPGGGGDASKAMDRARAGNPIQQGLSQGLDEYRRSWGSLPSIEIPAGPGLRLGSTGPRVRLLRARLGLTEEGGFDAELADKVRAFQAAHGLPSDGIAGAGTLQALNRGPSYYERLIEANLERARALPAQLGERYIMVDVPAARLLMYEDGQLVDTMRVIVGKPTHQTPMMAAFVRYAVLNPYWNVPPDLVRERIAPNVLDQGLGYLRERRYQLLSGFGPDAREVDPSTVDWQAVAAGREELRVRQLPGQGNMMGEVKFMMSGELGIYLHDTPDRNLFTQDDRRQSSGCVRLEDAQRLSRWLFQRAVAPDSPDPEQRVDLPEPVPVYITYLTAMPSEQGSGIVFRQDVYGRDAMAMAQLDAGGTDFASAR
ncbi:MAG TPA: L,D-transpeptidase family protein [Allosphingosinicella sp.]